MARERLAIHKRALALFDVAARLCRADATSDACQILTNAAAGLNEAQYVTHGPDYGTECDRVTAILDPLHDAIIKLANKRGETPFGK